MRPCGVRAIVSNSMKTWLVAAWLEIGVRDSVLLQFAVERGLADAEQARGHELVAIEMAQGAEDRLLLHLGNGANLNSQGRFGFRGSLTLFDLRAGVLQLRREIAEVKDRTAVELEC